MSGERSEKRPSFLLEELAELGFSFAVPGIDTIMHAAKAIEAMLIDMKSGNFASRYSGMNLEEYLKLVDYDKWVSIDDRFAPPG
jgi:2-methylisocitrate lyase-like PEP mutase family enzyme